VLQRFSNYVVQGFGTQQQAGFFWKGLHVSTQGPYETSGSSMPQFDCTAMEDWGAWGASL